MPKSQMKLANRAWRTETKIWAGIQVGRKESVRGNHSVEQMLRSQLNAKMHHLEIRKKLTKLYMTN